MDPGNAGCLWWSMIAEKMVRTLLFFLSFFFFIDTIVSLTVLPGGGTGFFFGALVSARPLNDDDNPGNTGEKEKGWVDETHETLSKAVLTSADWLDSFFRDERSEYEANTTRLRLGVQTFIEEGHGVEFKTRSSLRLVLPGFDEKVHLLFTANPDEDDLEIGGQPIDTPGDDDTSSDRDGLTASLRYFFLNTVKQNLSTSLGVRFKGITPVIYPQVRYRHLFDIDPWALRFEERVTWYSDEGWESKTQFDLEKPVATKFFFRSTWEGVWREERTGYNYYLNFRLYQTLGKTRVMSYEWNNSFETCPVHTIKQLVWKIAYRQSFWKEWLFIEAAPQLAMPEEEDFEINPGILLKVEGYFGNYQAKK